MAAFAALDRAAEAAERLGNLVQVGVHRADGCPTAAGGWPPGNPVFVAWGPGADPPEAGAGDGPPAPPP